MAWGTTDYVILTFSAVDYIFAPTELVYAGNPKYERNQVVQEAESGERKILELDDVLRQTFEFSINKMPSADRTIGGATIRGFSTLSSLILVSCEMRTNAITVKPPGTVFGGGTSCRFDSSSFFVPVVRRGASVNTDLYGGGATLKFRKEV